MTIFIINQQHSSDENNNVQSLRTLVSFSFHFHSDLVRVVIDIVHPVGTHFKVLHTATSQSQQSTTTFQETRQQHDSPCFIVDQNKLFLTIQRQLCQSHHIAYVFQTKCPASVSKTTSLSFHPKGRLYRHLQNEPFQYVYQVLKIWPDPFPSATLGNCRIYNWFCKLEHISIQKCVKTPFLPSFASKSL